MSRYDGWRRGVAYDDLGRGARPERGHQGPPSSGWRPGWRDPRSFTEAERYGRREALDDEEIRWAVRRSLFEDTWLDARDIEIGVQNGVVTLAGEVGDHLQARYAWDDAWDTAGVRGVISKLEVREEAHRGER